MSARQLLRVSFFVTVGLVLVSLRGPGARADTVYLKNGAWIDGRVRARNEKVVEIEIGRVGKIEIAAEEIHEIEKNNRTGEEPDSRGKLEEAVIDRFTREGKLTKPESSAAGTDSGATDAAAAGADPSSSAKKAGDKGKADEEDPASDSTSAKAEDGEGTSASSPKEKIDPQLKARIEELVYELGRQKHRWRVRSERYLINIGPPAVPFLLPLAKDSEDLIRTSVFRIFNEIGDERVIDASIAALGDSNEYVRDYANKTLERVTHEAFGYQSGASPRRREAAQEKWRKWWTKEKATLEKDREMAQSSR